jgi:hypothetical protein
LSGVRLITICIMKPSVFNCYVTCYRKQIVIYTIRQIIRIAQCTHALCLEEVLL